MENKFFILMLVFILVLPLVSAGALDLTPAIQLDKTYVLDSNYTINDSGSYFKGLKQDIPVVWIDKKVGTTYHVDSTKDFNKELNESVKLQFFYDIQPDWIKHITHSGEFDRYYFPTQWDWLPNCTGKGEEQECIGGWVIIDVENIEKGTGSSTFPIGIDGSTWARDGQFYGEFDGDSSYIDVGMIINGSTAITYSFWYKADTLTDEDAIIFCRGSKYNGISYEGSGNKIKWVYSNSSSGGSQTSSVDTFETGTYHHIVLSWESGVYPVVYIDSVSETISLNTTGYLVCDDNAKIGVDDIGARYFNGSLDEFLIYNRTLTQAEVTALYNNFTETSAGIRRIGTIDTDGLVLDINFDDYSVQDDSGQGNHGTNTNVTFGEVLSNFRYLSEGDDYSFNDADDTFTLLYSPYFLNLTYDLYTMHEVSESSVTSPNSFFNIDLTQRHHLYFMILFFFVAIGLFFFGQKMFSAFMFLIGGFLLIFSGIHLLVALVPFVAAVIIGGSS